jgi:hypothetical protein
MLDIRYEKTDSKNREMGIKNKEVCVENEEVTL